MSMKKLGQELEKISSRFPTDEKTLIARSAAKVQAMWKDAIEHVYKDVAPYVLDHVNAVYITDDDGVRTLMVYMDDGDFRSDVHCRQELIVLRMKERFGEEVEAFKTFPSRFDMRKRHPFAMESGVVSRETTKSIPLSDAERAEIDAACAPIEDRALRKALARAMVADREWKKGEAKENDE